MAPAGARGADVATMDRYRQTSVGQDGLARALCGCAAAAALALLVGGALAQQPQQIAPQQIQPEQVQPQSEPPAAASAPAPGGGFIDTFGRWIQDSVSGLNSGIKDTADAAKGAAGVAGDMARGVADAAGTATTATRDAAGAVARLPAARFVSAREICPVAPNGAPDCRTAAETICRAHGYATGSSADFQTYEKCPPIALNGPRGEPPGPCILESAVTRAFCQ